MMAGRIIIGAKWNRQIGLMKFFVLSCDVNYSESSFSVERFCNSFDGRIKFQFIQNGFFLGKMAAFLVKSGSYSTLIRETCDVG